VDDERVKGGRPTELVDALRSKALDRGQFTIYGNHITTKTTVYLDSTEYRRLKAIARAQGRPPAALVRDAVAEYTRRHGRRKLPRSLGAGHSGRGDLSERAEELLRGMGRPR